MRRELAGISLLVIGLTALVSHAALAQEQRPRIGVALSGGGARGCAHVGVLAELERLRIPVDMVAGTSMGAVVGGIYSTGMPIEEIARQMRNIDWDDALSDRTDYRRLDYRRKVEAQRYLLDFELGWKDGLRWPSGLRTGRKLKFLLQKFTHSASSIDDFDRLPVPFRAVAADIETGEEVVLGQGNLATAIRASMAIPGVFSPVEIGERLLVDGGIVNNLPVEVLREMGADIIIAVDIGTPLAQRDDLSGYFGITAQAMNLLARRSMESQLAAADLVITPDVRDIASLDFSDVGAVIERGREAAVAAEEQLRSLALGEQAWSAFRARQPELDLPNLTVEAVRIEGLVRTDPRRLLHRIHTQAGMPLDLEVVRQDLERLYGLGEFEQAEFALEAGDRENTRVLVLRLTEKSWGPNYLQHNLLLQGDLDGDTEFGLLANLTKTQITRRGGEWRTDVAAGAREGFFTELYLPVDWRGRTFVSAWSTYFREDLDFFIDSRLTSTLELETVLAGADVGLQLGRLGELRMGIQRGRVNFGIETGDLSVPGGSIQTGGLQAQLNIDTLDTPVVPRSGLLLGAALQAQREDLGAEDSYDKLEISANAFFSLGPHTLALGADLGSNLGSTLPFYDEFLIGGLLSLGGYADGELRGQRYGIGRLFYYRQLLALPSTLGRGLYAGIVLEGGNAWAEDVDLDDLRYSATAFLLADTVLGPMFFGYGLSDESSDRFYLTVGRTF